MVLNISVSNISGCEFINLYVEDTNLRTRATMPAERSLTAINGLLPEYKESFDVPVKRDPPMLRLLQSRTEEIIPLISCAAA